MAAASFQMRVPAHYLPAYVDIKRLKKKLESLVQRAQQQRATVQRRLDILQRPRMLPHGAAHGKPQKQPSPAAVGDQRDTGTPTSAEAAADAASTQAAASPISAVSARPDDGMGGSSLRAEAETFSLLPEAQFWTLLQHQVQELNKFATAKERQIQSDLRIIAARMEQFPELRGDEELLIEEQSAEIVHLDLYIRTNHKALLALCSHFDRLLTGAKTTRWFSTSLLKEAYCNVDLERLVLMLSLLWGKFRSKQVRAQCLIVRHLPFLVFGTSDKDLEASLLGRAACKEGQQLPATGVAPTQMVASVYFDTADAYSYERRIRRFQGAQLLRFRWYGTNNNGPDEEIFIERKTHHESWSGLSSTKERFVVPQRLVAPYMLLQRSARDLLLEASGFQPAQAGPSVSGADADSPGRTAEAASPPGATAVEAAAEAFIAKDKKLKKAIQLGEEIQEEIAEHELQPMVRISLDTNLCMVNEYRPQRKDDPSTNWCRLADELLGKDEVVRFPYAILEVKVQQQPPPHWVESMLLLSDATLVYKFSKFQHGMAFLHREKISSGLLPHWLQTSLTQPQQQQREEQRPAQQQQRGHGRAPLGASLFESVRNSADSLLTPLARSFADHQQQRLSAVWSAGPRQRSLVVPSEGGAVQGTDNDWMEQDLQVQQAPRPIGTDGSVEGQDEGVRPHVGVASSADSLRQRLVRRHIRTVRKIDPKTSFAGERTFLHYIQKGLYLAGASIACLETLSGGWGLAIALVLAGACTLLCCGAYAIYASRCRRISQRVAKASAAKMRQRIDSQWGPLLAFGAAGLATVLVLILQVDVNLKHVLRQEQAEQSTFYETQQSRAASQFSPHLSEL